MRQKKRNIKRGTIKKPARSKNPIKRVKRVKRATSDLGKRPGSDIY